MMEAGTVQSRIRRFSFKRVPLMVALFLMLTGLFSSLICNEKPLISKNEMGIAFPAMVDFGKDWGFVSRNSTAGRNNYTWAIYPLVRFSHNTIDRMNMDSSRPGSLSKNGHRHVLGTDKLGRDVLAGVIRGLFHCVRIGLLATFISMILGVVMGQAAVHYGDSGWRINGVQLIISICFIVLGVYILLDCFLSEVGLNWVHWVYLVILFLLGFLYKSASRAPFQKFALPVDGIVMRFVEIRKSIPVMILLLAILPLFKNPSSINITIVLTALGWISFARYARAEGLNVSKTGYILVAKALGIGFWRTLVKHYWPNTKDTILVIFIFIFMGNIIIESSLSFLGIGLPADDMSFGTLISQGRRDMEAWWVTVFPGLTIFILLIVLNQLRSKSVNRSLY